MTAGAWSNTFDRWIRGYVIDYAAVKCRHQKLSKITFNLGDVLIGIDVFVVICGSDRTASWKEEINIRI